MKCVVRGCLASAEGGELCIACRSYLAGATTGHATLIRRRDLLPRLETIHRALMLPSSEPMNKAAVASLGRYLEELR